MFSVEYNLSPSYLVHPVSASKSDTLLPLLFAESIHHHHFSCKSPVRSKFDIMMSLHNSSVLDIISLLMFSDVSFIECPFFDVLEDDSCGGCFVTWEDYTCRVYFSPAVELTLLYRRNSKYWFLTFKWASYLWRYAWHLCWISSSFSSNIIFHFLQIMSFIYITSTFQYQIWRSVVNLWVINHSLNDSFGSSHW